DDPLAVALIQDDKALTLDSARLAAYLQQAVEQQGTLDLLLKSCEEARNVMQLVEILYPRKLSIFDLFLGCGECLAHLNYLLAEQKIERWLDENDVHQYLCV
ncbi:hypothetical protein, partial [Pontibacterium sp.]|uniref:hypothetical protein n=1 Tax=Pontibacterium sp. TaxID=2036026 RepID=UPI00356A56A0